MMELTIAVVAAFCGTFFLMRPLISQLKSRDLLDLPGRRTSHQAPTPRGGGLGVVAGVGLGLLVIKLLGGSLPSAPFLLMIAALAALGWADDFLRGISAKARLLSQSGLAVGYVYLQGGLTSLPLPAPLDVSVGWVGGVVSVIWIVGVTNIFNFLDGIDGFAGVQAAIAGCTAFLVFSGAIGSFGLIVVGASFAFLLFNWHPARVFMGDVGSLFLGGALALSPFEAADISTGSAVLFQALVLWFFLSDGAYTLFTRWGQGEKVWTPHRSHLYQRLSRCWGRHDHVVRTVGGAQLGLAGLATLVWLGLIPGPGLQWAVMAVALAAFGGYLLLTKAAERHPRRGPAEEE